MKLETNRLMITEFKLDDAKAVHENSLDEDTRRFLPDEVFETVEDAKETIEFLMEQYEEKDGPLVYPMFTKDHNENVGYVELVPYDDMWEIGYHVGKKYTCNGYATEATKAFLVLMAQELELKEILGITLKENVASIKVLEKCGFEMIFEGIGEYQGEDCEIIKMIWRA